MAIAIGLRTAAGAAVAGIEETAVRALAKLEQLLPARLRGRVNALQTSTEFLGAQWSTVAPEALATLASACRDAERVRFRYTARDGVASRRMVEPHRLVSAGRRWYLVAWDVDRGDWRTFRVDRLDDPQATGVRATRRELPAADAAAFVAQALAATSSRYRAVVTLHAPLAELAGRVRAGEDELEAVDAVTCRLRTSADSVDWLVFAISAIGVDFEVHEPPELVEHVRTLGARFGRATARPSGAP